MKTEHARIAEAVVAELFTSCDGEAVERLELIAPSTGRQLGGVGRAYVRNAVLRALAVYDEPRQKGA